METPGKAESLDQSILVGSLTLGMDPATPNQKPTGVLSDQQSSNTGVEVTCLLPTQVQFESFIFLQ